MSDHEERAAKLLAPNRTPTSRSISKISRMLEAASGPRDALEVIRLGVEPEAPLSRS